MLTLKNYQNTTLENLRLFLEDARFGNHGAAFEKCRTESARRAAPLAYRPLKELEDTPYICLRLPTGGGKTLLGAYTISTAAQAFLERDFPLVLWLVPTNTIRQQTLQTLPDEWQSEFVALLEELDEAIDWRPKEGRYWVQLKDKRGRYVADPLMDYERGRRRLEHKKG